ncbi:MAG TPA: molybdopterin-dependent oxidoreductase [Candidatus Udaeobacter sp.]|jgi:NADH-quinone oxidoreductase subunit G|nr:molybdopterin-dependent oxidoreductase [Candidatus Udaeobacter sp.]
MSEELSVPMLNVQIDGTWHQFPKGTRVIEACEQAGVFVPRYCYHKKLSSPGNCRMCLIEMGFPRLGPDRKPELGADGKPIINWMPRPQICCAQDVAEGMAVRTESPLVKECRNGVMEFLLINHPLDCPICDQAGECQLQEFSVDYGNSESRFLENKVKKPKAVQLGPRVTLDDERCILCSRCIRFCQEIAHDDVLGFVNRGSHTVLTAHPGKRLENNYSLNTVDICPVGALTSTDFRFKMRVWFLRETKSICTSCATGCNTVIGTREDVIYRQTPRENEHVNSCWMCDYGRLNYKYLEAENRLLEPQIRSEGKLTPADWPTAIGHAAFQLKQFEGSEIAIVASARMTNEELWITAQLAQSLGVERIDIVPRRGHSDDILLSKDRNPNTHGARLILGSNSEPGAKLMGIANAIRSGDTKALVILKENAMHLGLSVEQLANLRALIVMNILPNEATKNASIVLPGCGFAEKRGSMVNGKGRLQRLNRATRPPGNARDDWEILRDLLQAVGGGNSLHSIDDVFRRISETVPRFAGLSHSKLGDLGVHILQLEELPSMHPSDEAAIEEAIAVQEKRREVQQELREAQAHPGAPSVEAKAQPGQ